MSYSFGRVLALSPHTDDGESSCGGSISKWLEEAKKMGENGRKAVIEKYNSKTDSKKLITVHENSL